MLGLLTVTVGAAITFSSATYNTVGVSENAVFGSANHRVEVDEPNLLTLPGDVAAAAERFGAVDVIARWSRAVPGSVESVEYRVQDPDGPFSAPMLALRGGRYPTDADEVALTDGIVDMLQIGVGDVLGLDGHERTVVGTIENPSDLNSEFALVAPDDDGLAQSVTILIGGGGDFDEVHAIREFGADHLPNADVTTRGDVENAQAAAVVLGVAQVVLVLVALVAAAGFITRGATSSASTGHARRGRCDGAARATRGRGQRRGRRGRCRGDRGRRRAVVAIADPEAAGGGDIGALDYDALLAGGDPAGPIRTPEDEWAAISLSYTSGTTGDPKGVVAHHRGAYLNSCANALAFELTPRSVYLWTVPMFHANGWTYPWAVTLQGATHVCLRRVEAGAIFAAIAEHGVTHMCAAPVVLGMLIHAPEGQRRGFTQTVRVATGGAAPPAAVIAKMETMGFAVTHLYGLTETFGPATICLWQPGLDDMPLEQKAAFAARQGVAHPLLEEATVIDRDTLAPLPADGATLGEIVLRGNSVMKGYLRNPEATAAAFAGGCFHTGDLGVLHPDGYIEVKDRAKDIVISGGENISSLEVEGVLYRYPKIAEAAVVAQPDERWGEVPHAFVVPAPGAGHLSEAEVIAWCRDHLAHFKCPRNVTFGPLPKTATGKIQKFELRQRLRGAETGVRRG